MEEKKYKEYVSVEMSVDVCGRVHPTAIIWEDGKRFEIDRILDIRPSTSQKGGGIGTRFTCRIRGLERYLYWENPRWFVEI